MGRLGALEDYVCMFYDADDALVLAFPLHAPTLDRARALMRWQLEQFVGAHRAELWDAAGLRVATAIAPVLARVSG